MNLFTKKNVIRLGAWIIILITPTAGWFLFTDNGRAAYQDGFVSRIIKGNVSKVSSKQIVPAKPLQFDQRIFKNAKPVEIKPRLKISVKLQNFKANEYPIVFPIKVFIVDSFGNKAGYDSDKKKKITEINFSRIDLSANTISIDIKQAKTLDYKLQIVAGLGADYQLAIGGVSPTQKSSTTIQNGRVDKNKIVEYQINLRNVEPLSFNARQNSQRLKKPAEKFISAPTVRVNKYSKLIFSDVCNAIQKKLKDIPGQGVVESLAECSFKYSGKRIVDGDFQSHSIFYPFSHSQEYADGWVADREADGPDGGYFRFKNQNIICEASGQWDGGLDDKPSYIPSDDYTIHVSCIEKSNIQTARPGETKNCIFEECEIKKPKRTLKQHAQKAPPKLFIDKDYCPFECCGYGDWEVRASSPVYEQKNETSKIVGHLQRGNIAYVEKGEGHVEQGQFKITKVKPGKRLIRVDEEENKTIESELLKVGDILYLYSYMSEGFYRVWFNGSMYETLLSYGGFEGDVISEAKSSWWVHVKSPFGWNGWTKQPFNFGGNNGCPSADPWNIRLSIKTKNNRARTLAEIDRFEALINALKDNEDLTMHSYGYNLLKRNKYLLYIDLGVENIHLLNKEQRRQAISSLEIKIKEIALSLGNDVESETLCHGC